jgi:hypothetical protein
LGSAESASKSSRKKPTRAFRAFFEMTQEIRVDERESRALNPVFSAMRRRAPAALAQAAMRAQNRDKLAEMVSGLGKGTTGSGSKAAWTVELQSSGVARITPQNLTTTHIESVMNQMWTGQD